MSKKQWVCLAVALILFALAGAWSAERSNQAARQDTEGTFSYPNIFSSTQSMLEEPLVPFLAQVDIHGTIADSDASGISMSEGCDPAVVTEYIDWLMDSDMNVGILLHVDSGGGTMDASDEIYLKLMDYKAATGRPVYAYFEDTACSGAYYIAMAADEIFADRNCLCVNIGVYISTYNLSGLFEKYGIEEVMIRSSENKGIGSRGTPWTEEQLAIYQSIVDLYYAQFLQVVAGGRNMTAEQVKALDDGREMLASQALEAGFIDGICRWEEYWPQVLDSFDADVVLYEQPQAEQNALYQLFSGIYGKLAALKPRSDGELLQEFADGQTGIVVMAYGR